MTASSRLPEELRYTETHEWFRTEGEEATIGVTDHAQSELTDVVFVDLPAVGKAVNKGQSILVLESVKTVADVYAPFPATVSAVNTELKAHPELVNQDPYGKGWLVRLRAAPMPDPSTVGLSAAEYRASIEKGH
jgi:glycine cleavage system H protein